MSARLAHVAVADDFSQRTARTEQVKMKRDDSPSAENAVSQSAIVEGCVVQHAVRWQSVPEQLNFGLSTVKMGDDLFDSSTNSVPPGDGDGVSRGSYSQQGRAIPRPPRVSVTLSDYLAADFGQSPDDPGDFGWFTPSVSGGSIEDLLPSSDIRDTYPAPSPTYPRTPLLFKAWDSTQKTASLSPESVADDLASYPREAPSPEGPADSNGKQQTSFTSFCRPPGGSAASNAAANSGTIASGIPQDQQQKHEEQQRFMPRGESTLPCNSSSSTSNDVNERAYITAATSGATASTSGNKRGSLPAYRPSQKKMADINQWHALHPYASSTGPLAASSEGGGACIMHLKRPTFPISTRHFPEKAPTPTAAWNRGGRERGWRGGETQHNDRANLKGSPVLFGTRGTTAPGACEAGLRDGRHDSRTSPSSSQDDARGSGGTGGRANSSMGPRLRKSKAKRFAWALTEIRVVAGSAPWCPPRAEYLVVAVLGRGKLVAGWRRASDFERLAIVARQSWMTKACVAWETLERARRMDGGGPCNLPWVMRPRRLDALYLMNKARFLEEFLKQFIFEASSKDALLTFLDVSRRSTMEL